MLGHFGKWPIHYTFYTKNWNARAAPTGVLLLQVSITDKVYQVKTKQHDPQVRSCGVLKNHKTPKDNSLEPDILVSYISF